MSYKFSSAGKGAQDRSSVAARASSPLWKQVKLNNGVNFSPEEAAAALNDINIFLNNMLKDKNIDSNLVADIKDWQDKHYHGEPFI